MKNHGGLIRFGRYDAEKWELMNSQGNASGIQATPVASCMCMCVHRFNKRFHFHDAGGASRLSEAGTNEDLHSFLWYENGTPFPRTFLNCWTSFLLRLFRYILTGSIFDLPEFIVSNVTTSPFQIRRFQRACAWRQLRTLSDDSDIVHKFHTPLPHSWTWLGHTVGWLRPI